MKRTLATLLSLSGVAGGVAAQNCDLSATFDHARFSTPTRIANRWMPLVPGTQFILEGRSNRGGGPLPHRVILTVTDLTKVIDGVRTVVLWDRDMNEGDLEESELAFHAQDNDGNVWGLGEYPEEYEDGRFHGAPKTWIAGQEGAKAGLAIPADPRIGSAPYLQGLSAKIDFYDCGRVHEMGQHVCIAGSCYDSVLVIDEWSPHDPESGHQRKFYAPGVGNVQIGAVDDPEDETLVLVKVVQLSPQELADARAAALALEKHAMQVSAVYRLTSPMEHMP
jgi:hypothetical protein